MLNSPEVALPTTLRRVADDLLALELQLITQAEAVLSRAPAIFDATAREQRDWEREARRVADAIRNEGFSVMGRPARDARNALLSMANVNHAQDRTGAVRYHRQAVGFVRIWRNAAEADGEVAA